MTRNRYQTWDGGTFSETQETRDLSARGDTSPLASHLAFPDLYPGWGEFNISPELTGFQVNMDASSLGNEDGSVTRDNLEGQQLQESTNLQEQCISRRGEEDLDSLPYFRDPRNTIAQLFGTALTVEEPGDCGGLVVGDPEGPTQQATRFLSSVGETVSSGTGSVLSGFLSNPLGLLIGAGIAGYLYLQLRG